MGKGSAVGLGYIAKFGILIEARKGMPTPFLPSQKELFHKPP
jgi:hypothetical protein